MILYRRVSVIGLALLFLVAANIAIAQRGSTTKQDLEPRNLTDAPSDLIPPTVNTRSTLDRWAPPDIDAIHPLVAQAASCSLPDVISHAGMRVQELVHNLDQISATEVIEHKNVNRSGNLQRPEIQKFNYVYSIKETSDGHLFGEEYRGRDTNPEQFVDQIATTEIPSLVVHLLHPNYVRNFRMSCEGLGEWRGQPAWQIRFEERSDGTYSTSNITIDGKTYRVKFRGRAWILADSYQLVHMDTDLVEIIPKIRLRLYHQALEYLPVSFPNSDARLWLPSSAELYMDFKGHRFYRRLSYIDFKLFSVKVQQNIGPTP